MSKKRLFMLSFIGWLLLYEYGFLGFFSGVVCVVVWPFLLYVIVYKRILFYYAFHLKSVFLLGLIVLECFGQFQCIWYFVNFFNMLLYCVFGMLFVCVLFCLYFPFVRVFFSFSFSFWGRFFSHVVFCLGFFLIFLPPFCSFLLIVLELLCFCGAEFPNFCN